MKRLQIPGFTALCSAMILAAALAVAQQKPQLGTRESGAPKLVGYMVEGKICLPIKRFAYESGYDMSVSPSRRHVAIVVGRRAAYLYNGDTAQIDNKPFPLSIKPLARDNDWYVPIEFFKEIYPVRFTFLEKSKALKTELPRRTFQIPIESPPSLR